MHVGEVREAVLRDFVFCVERQKIPPLSGYLADYVKTGSTVVPEDFRLVPLTPSTLRCLLTSSDCATDCMIELQCKYQQFIPDSWGGRTERGSRDLAVIGFNILEGIVLEIREVNTTTSFRDWAEPNLNRLRWDGLLIHAVIDFGRACQAREVTLPSASSGVGGARPQSGLVKPAELQAELEARYDGNAKAFGFGYDAGRGSFVLNLAADVRPIPSSATSRSAGAGGATSPA